MSITIALVARRVFDSRVSEFIDVFVPFVLIHCNVIPQVDIPILVSFDSGCVLSRGWIGCSAFRA